ncbi:MAG: hypothetical protein L0211_21350, partial [Planctomycetaceae bacterium]|nr:hypothetical protein [Planctomycetaceae bacterium]
MSRLTTAFILALAAAPLVAEDKPAEFSGPQAGEKLTPFATKVVLGDQAGKEIDLVKAAAGKPVLIVFVHERNRPTVGLARLLGLYAATKKEAGLRSGIVFLVADATETETWMNRAQGALPGGVPVGISADGQEGPGAYGLNRKVQMTILVGKEDKVTANFALVQPSVQADAPKIAQAIVDVLGGGRGPTIEELQKLGGPMRPAASPRRKVE